MFSHRGKTSARARRETVVAERGQAGKQRRGLRQMPAQLRPAPCRPSRRTCRHSSRSCPAFRNFFACGSSGFSRKLPNCQHVACARPRALREFDVAVAGFRPARLDPQHRDLALSAALETPASAAAGIASACRSRGRTGNTPNTAFGIDRTAGCAPPARSPAPCCAAPARPESAPAALRAAGGRSHRARSRWSGSRSAPAESPAASRSTVSWISERSPTTFSTCLAWRLRLRGQKRVPRPPARIRP